MPRLSTSCVAPCLLIFLCGVMCLLNSEPCLSPIIFYMTQIDRWDNLPSFHIYLHKTMFLFSSLGKEEICMETIYIFMKKGALCPEKNPAYTYTLLHLAIQASKSKPTKPSSISPGVMLESWARHVSGAFCNLKSVWTQHTLWKWPWSSFQQMYYMYAAPRSEGQT